MQAPKKFYYIAHKDNLKSLLEEGILSRGRIDQKKWSLRNIFSSNPKSIHAKDVLQKRKFKKFKNRTLWDYANVYFQARNPMLYRVISKFQPQNIIVLEVNSDILRENDIGITDGNAASSNTRFFENVQEGLNALDIKQFEKDYWNASDKRQLMAELLVYDKIPKDKITAIYVAEEKMVNSIRKEIGIGPLNIIPNRHLFFAPEYKNKISKNITLAKGDMFFSKMQTFTVSVNTVGIMGKGLASRAKYQFPDVYVKYQDVCRQKKLTMGTPYIYKREENFTSMLIEETNTFVTENGSRWFLLFPTKNHWKTNSPIEGIEDGLKWLLNNYQKEGIHSLAIPALGCGLGGLQWKTVGPLMCRYISEMEIQSCIYLPIEKEVPSEQLTQSFLLEQNSL